MISRTFTVTLPKDRDLTEAEFSAYAFNDDRVKSETHRTVYKLPQPLKASAKGRAYLITIGVAASEDLAPALTILGSARRTAELPTRSIPPSVRAAAAR